MILSSSMLLNKQNESEFPEPSQETVQSNSGSRRGLRQSWTFSNENFAKLRVFYKTLDHIIYRQQPKYQVAFPSSTVQPRIDETTIN
ncbi:uncharacterized protein LOC143243325 isoform X2 [Tachypleus tridentatus]|uniref:uncharacterized protein LOC143243139 isoform X2 n=1 Tax=Tachypleus tridentatus TaxID=6853 RepID=UPI003FD31657